MFLKDISDLAYINTFELLIMISTKFIKLLEYKITGYRAYKDNIMFIILK